MRPILLAAAAFALAMPAMAKTASEMTPDDYKQVLHSLQKLKPTAFSEAKQCIAKWNAKSFDEVRYCVALAFDTDVQPEISMTDFARFMIVKSNATSAMAKCIVERNARLTEETWDFCLDNSYLTPEKR